MSLFKHDYKTLATNSYFLENYPNEKNMLEGLAHLYGACYKNNTFEDFNDVYTAI